MGAKFKEMCRLCMGKESDMLPLFVEQDNLSERIMNFVPTLKLCTEDGLPAQVCSQCVQRVHECYNFKLHCETTDATLRQLLTLKDIVDEHFGAIAVKEEPDINITIEEGPLNFDNCNNIRDKDDIKVENEEKHEITIDMVKLDQQSNVKNPQTSSSTSETAQEILCKKKRYTCKECGKQFPVPNELKRHMVTHTGEKNFICRFCGKRYSFSRSLIYHYKSHADEKPFECKKCDKKFSYQVELKKHVETHVQDGEPSITKIVCHICGQLLANNTSLRFHMLTHTGERPFTCNICRKSYNRKKYLEVHMLTHSGEKPYLCDQCGARFAQKPTLRVHKLTHTGERKHVCEQCGKKFRTKAKLQAHHFSHTGEREYQCEICHKEFSRKYCLVKHVRLHMVDQPLSCPTCGKLFERKDCLQEHLLTHSGQKL